MIFLKYLLLAVCFGAALVAAATVVLDIYMAFELDRMLKRGEKRAAADASSEKANAETLGQLLTPAATVVTPTACSQRGDR
jgi:heme O synthase-like polyprenyltransferase